nr:tape measure protein [Leptolyngbya sp. FACHB-541]
MRKFEESLEGVNEALDSDGTKIVAQVQKTIADYERTVQELEKSYAERFQTSQDDLDETFRYREAYAGLLGDGQDPQELDLAIVPPKPPSGEGLFGALKGDLDDIVERLGGLKNAAGVAFKAIVGFAAASIVLPFLTDLATSALETATEMEQVGRMFNFAYGSMAEGQSVMADVKADAEALGLDMRQALQGQAQLGAATRGTKLEGFATEQIGDASRDAISAYSLNPQQAERVNLAIQQMSSKGKISAEELRQQLGESLPGAFQIAARAMGVTTAELDKMMERGELLSEEFLPRFAAQLSAETAGAIPGAMKSSQAAINRFNNAILELQTSLGKPLLPARNAGLEVLTKGMELASSASGVLVKGLGALVITPVVKMLFDVAAGAIASAKGMTLAGLGAKTLNFSMKSLANTAKAVKGALGAIALPAAIFLAIDVISSFGKAFKDAGGEVREFADQGVKSLAEYDKALADLQNRSGRGVTPPEPPQPTGVQTEFGDTGGSLLGGPLGTLERFIQSDNPAAIGFRMTSGMGAAPMRTFGQVEAEQQAIAQSDFLRNTGDTRGRLLEELQRYQLNPNGEGLIAQVRGIDQQVEEAQGQRRALLPGDVEGRRALDKEIDDLLQQRQKPGEVLASLQTINNAKIQQLQQMINQAAAEGDTAAVARFQSELDATTAAVDKLNGLIGKTPDVLGRLARGFAEIQAELEKVNMELDRSAASNRKAIASAQIAGATPGELEFARSLADQTNMRGRMNANQSAIDQARNTLTSSDKTMEALKSVGINSIDEINPTALSGQIQNMEDSTTKGLIEQAIQQKQQIDSLTTQNFDLDAQIKESQAAAVEKLRSLANQVFDFFRSIEQSAKEIQLNAQQTALQIKTETAQSRLKGALVGFQDSFLNDFVNSLIGLIEALNKPLNDAIAAQQQILSAQNQYFQQIQQSFQLGQQLPSNQQVAAMAGEQAAPSDPFTPLPAGLPVAPAAPGNQAAIAPASQRPEASLPAIPVGSTQMTAPEIQGNLGALAQLDPVSAQAFSQQGLAGAQAQAAQNYQAQVDMINQQLAASQQFAQLEAVMQADAANRSLWEATRRIDDTSRGYQRSLEDLFARGEVETPLTQIQGTFRGMAREFEDSMRGMEDFRRGLQQTVDQAEMLQQVIRDGVAQGIMPREMLQMLPQLQQMSDAARDDLNELAGTMTDYEQAYGEAVRRQQNEFKRQEGERRFQARQRLSGYDVQMYGAQAQQARLGGNEGVARSLEYRAKYLETQNQYEGQFRELQELQRTGQITADEFERMAESLRGLNQISLRNLRTEVEKTNNEVAASALFGGQGQDMSRRDRRRVLRDAREDFRLAVRNGELNQSQQREFREAFSAVSGRDNASDDSLVRLSNRFQDNAFFNELMQMTGRGDITAIAGISEQTASTRMTETADQGSSMVQAFREANGGIEQRLDTLNGNIVLLANSPRSLTVQTPDPVNDMSQILSEQSRQKMEAAGL